MKYHNLVSGRRVLRPVSMPRHLTKTCHCVSRVEAQQQEISSASWKKRTLSPVSGQW